MRHKYLVISGVALLALILGTVTAITAWQVSRAMVEKPVDILRPEA